MQQVNIVLTPRDGLFLSTGRGWFSGAAGRAETVDWPFPSTLCGAVRTLVGRAAEKAAGKRFAPKDWLSLADGVTIGRSVALRRDSCAGLSAAERMWPAPADSVAFLGDVNFTRLKPCPLPATVMGAEDDRTVDGLQHPAPAQFGKPVRTGRWWTEQQFVEWLVGSGVVRVADAADLPRRVEGHTAIDATSGTAADSKLFSMDIVETIDENGLEWCIAVEVTSASAAIPGSGAVVVGGNGKVAKVAGAPPTAFDFPSTLRNACAGGFAALRLVAVTPAVFEGGWLPDGFDATGDGRLQGRLPAIDADVELCAACVPRPDGVSGWDVARGCPKPTSRLVPAGSVFFVRRRDGGKFGCADVAALWLAQWGERTEEGFGRFVAGAW